MAGPFVQLIILWITVLSSVMRVAVFHDQDAPASTGCGDGGCGWVVHGVMEGQVREDCLGVSQGSGALTQAQVGAAAMGAGDL